MKKILYINYMLQYGHINFDLIHINALLSQGYDVKVIAHARVAQRMNLPEGVLLLALPDWLDLDTGNGILNRVMYLVTLLFIRMHVKVKAYDQVIISNVDEVSLALLSPCRDMLVYCHNPYSCLQSRVKAYFLKQLAQHNRLMVFNESMKTPFLQVGITQVGIISHGCMPSFRYHETTSIDRYVKEGQRVVFHPSHRPNQRFLCELLADERLQKQLEESNTVFLMRDRSGRYQSKGRIRILADYLTAEEYQNLFLKADVILLAYPDDFRYKVSGVSYECFANQKNLLILESPSFSYCKDFYNYDPIFKTTHELSEKLNMLYQHPEYRCTAKAGDLAPDFNSNL